MTDTPRASRVDRRAVLGGLLAGTGTALAPVFGRAAEKDPPPPAHIESIEISARPIRHFERDRPEAKRFGQLEFRGGLVLNSPSTSFGGWSGLVVEADGKSLLSISDEGSWMTASVVYDGGRPIGLTRARLGPLLGSRGQPLTNKREQDAEGLTLLDGTLQHGTLLISFERVHRIGRFPIRNGEVGAPVGYLKLPADARGMRENQGIEAVAVLKGGPHKGSIVAFAERLTRGSGYHTGWIWIGSEGHKFQLQDIDGFNITDATGLPDGSLLVLERYFRWTEGVKMRLRHIAAGEIAPGARITGRTLFQGELELRHRQHGGAIGASQRQRRDDPLAHLGRQLQPPAAAYAVPAIRAPRRQAAERIARIRHEMSPPSDIGIRHQLKPGDLGMVVHLHGVVYAREYGLDTTFEPYVAKPLADFVLDGSGRLWIAEDGERIVGCIALVEAGEGVGQLRWFLVVPEARGIGLGRRLLEEALSHARQLGLAHIYLWSFADLSDALRLYERAGFKITETMTGLVWGAERTEVRMDLDL